MATSEARGSLAQERIRFLQRLHPGARLFEFPLVLRFDGPLDTDALRAAFAATWRRHPILNLRPVDTPDGLRFAAGGGTGALPVVEAGPDAPAVPPLAEGELFAARLVRIAPERHLLQLCVDHLVFDGASAQILVDDLLRAYAGHPGPAPAAGYFDFAERDRAWVDSGEGAAAIRRCQELFAAVDPLDLPVDRPRGPVPSPAGARHRGTLGPQLGRAVRGYASARRVTLSAVLTAALALTLARRCQTERVVLAVPYLNRDLPEWADVVGLFATIAPIRLPVPPGGTFDTLVDAVQRETVRVLGDGAVPFERVVSAARPVRDAARPPLCPVSMQVLPPDEPVVLPDGVRVRILDSARRTSEFELDVHVVDAPDLPVVVEYASALFDPATVAGIVAEFATVCARALAEPAAPLHRIDHHPAGATELFARGRAAPMPPTGALPAALYAQVVRRPHAPALVGDGGVVSYAQLWRRAHAVADRLGAAGVGRGECVAVAARDRGTAVVSALGVLLAGAGYLPVDPDLPAARVSSMVDIARVRLAVTDSPASLARLAPALTAVTTAGLTAGDGTGALRPPVGLCGADLAYAMFTSGSTGEPKAVAVPHAGITGLVEALSFVAVGDSDVVAQLAPFAFDASVLETWLALLNGAVLALPPASPLGLGQLSEFVAACGVTVLHLTAGLLRVVAEEHPDLASPVRHLLTGGDVVPAGHVDLLLGRHPGLRVTACYGPTENSVLSSTMELQRYGGDGAAPLGLALRGREMHVVDGDLRPAAYGVPGELLVGGPGLARGYLNRPGATAERFVPHPVAPGQRLYRTGDVGRLRSDGVAEFLHRRDGQLKIRGFRVEPAEIDAALRRCPDVRDAVTRPRVVAGAAAVVGYVAAGGGAAEADLLAHLRQQLPEHAVPARVVVLDRLPVTTSGKIDGRALDALPLPAAPAPEPVGTGPARVVAEVFAEVLELPAVALDADFFALGGHSLAALRVVARIERRLGVAVPVAVLFSARTPRGLAGWIDTAGPVDAPAPDPADDPLGALGELTGAGPDEIAALLTSVSAKGRPWTSP